MSNQKFSLLTAVLFICILCSVANAMFITWNSVWDSPSDPGYNPSNGRFYLNKADGTNYVSIASTGSLSIPGVGCVDGEGTNPDNPALTFYFNLYGGWAWFGEMKLPDDYGPGVVRVYSGTLHCGKIDHLGWMTDNHRNSKIYISDGLLKVNSGYDPNPNVNVNNNPVAWAARGVLLPVDGYELDFTDLPNGAGEVRAHKKHNTVSVTPNTFCGWPANYGAWNWGDDILVHFSRDGYLEQGPFLHNSDGNGGDYSARSYDGGKSWYTEELWSGSNWLPDPGGAINFTHPDFALKVCNGGLEDYLYFSYDRGHTWYGPRYFCRTWIYDSWFSGLKMSSRTDYIVNSQNECFLFLSAEPITPGTVTTSGSDIVFMAKTTDGGQTFNFQSFIVSKTNPYRGVMPSTVRISSTKLVTAVRRRAWPNDTNWIDAYVSYNNGNSWSFLSKIVDNSGQMNGNPPALVRLNDGRLVCLYGDRNERKMEIRVSTNQGSSWNSEVTIRNDFKPDVYNDPDFGYPRMVKRADGKLVGIYYWTTLEQYNNHCGAIESSVITP